MGGKKKEATGLQYLEQYPLTWVVVRINWLHFEYTCFPSRVIILNLNVFSGFCEPYYTLVT